MSQVTTDGRTAVISKVNNYLGLGKHWQKFSRLTYLILIKFTDYSFVSCSYACANKTVLLLKGYLGS